MLLRGRLAQKDHLHSGLRDSSNQEKDSEVSEGG